MKGTNSSRHCVSFRNQRFRACFRRTIMEISVKDYARECAEQGLRGDYSACRSDFTVAQDYNYSDAEQAVWRTLSDRQTKLTEAAGAQILSRRGRNAWPHRPHPGFRRDQRKAAQADRLADRRRAGPDSGGALLRSPRQPAFPGHQLAAQKGRTRLHRRARHVPRFLRPCARPGSAGFCRFHADVRAKGRRRYSRRAAAR